MTAWLKLLGMRERWARDTAYSFSGRGNSGDNDVGPILLPPRDYDTVHRHRGNLAGIEFRRCLNQTIVGGSTTVDRGGTRSAASSGIGSDSAATPPPYQSHHPLGPRPSRPSRDSSSGKSIIPASILFFFSFWNSYLYMSTAVNTNFHSPCSLRTSILILWRPNTSFHSYRISSHEKYLDLQWIYRGEFSSGKKIIPFFSFSLTEISIFIFRLTIEALTLFVPVELLFLFFDVPMRTFVRIVLFFPDFIPRNTLGVTVDLSSWIFLRDFPRFLLLGFPSFLFRLPIEAPVPFVCSEFLLSYFDILSEFHSTELVRISFHETHSSLSPWIYRGTRENDVTRNIETDSVTKRQAK